MATKNWQLEQAPDCVSYREMDDLFATLLKAEKVREELTRRVIGQEYAADKIKTSIVQAYALQPAERRGPRTLILEVGLPGTGKSESAVIAAKELGLPCYNIDCTRYAEREGHNADGINKSYRDASEGEITGPVKKLPAGVLILNEFDMSHPNVKNRFQPLFETGFLHDKYHEEEVDFRNVVIIITSNAGNSLYESIYRYNYATMPEAKILNALRADVNEDTGTHRFTPAMISRFAKGVIIPFNKLDGKSLCSIAALKAEELCKEWKQKYPQLQVIYDEDLFSRSLLFQKGAQADARNVTASSQRFLSEHLENVATLVGGQEKTLRSLKKMQFRFDYQKSEDAVQYFDHKEKYRVAVYCSETEKKAFNAAKVFDVEYVSFDKRISAMEYDALFISVDETRTHGGLEKIRQAHMDEEVPIYVFSLKQKKTVVDQKLYHREGVSGIYNADDKESFKDWLKKIAETVELVKAVTNLARENCILNFDAFYELKKDENGDITGVVTLKNYRKEKVIYSGDEAELCADHEIPDVKFEDVKGAGETLQEIRELIDMLKNPVECKRQGYKVPKGVLLYGLPGTGKTYLAKAIANESGMTFIQKNATEFESKWLGESAKNLRTAFAMARKYRGILFIDEIDSFGHPRDYSPYRSEGSSRLQNAFLSEMDGFKEDDKHPVFVIAATNFPPDQLDKAFVRRFDRVIEIKPPKQTERIEILNYYLKKNQIELSEADVELLADRTAGKTPADLAKLIDHAKRNAKGATITLKDLEVYLEELLYGKKEKWSEEVVKKTTYHESGHCIMDYLTGGMPTYITNISRGSHGGYVLMDTDEDKFEYTYDELLDKICVMLAGRAAERIVYGAKGLTTGASSDLDKARSIARQAVDAYGMQEDFLVGALHLVSEKSKQELDERINQILIEQYARATKMLTEKRDILEALTAKLMKVNSMNQNELRAFFEGMES